MKRFDISMVRKPKTKAEIDNECLKFFNFQWNNELDRKDVFTLNDPYLKQFYEKEALKMASDYFN